MGPENIENREAQTQSQLHRVTPLSKYIAMALFIILLLIGVWMGYTAMLERIAVKEIEVIKEVEVVNEIATPSQDSDVKITEEKNSNSLENKLLSYVRKKNFVDENINKYGVSFMYVAEPICDSSNTEREFSISTGDGSVYQADCKGVVDHLYSGYGTYQAEYLEGDVVLSKTIVELK